MRLQGKRALVTGASQGIGEGIALEFARSGCDVAVNYRGGRDRAESVCGRIREMGRRAFPFQADVSSPHERDELMHQSIAALGALDILVNNAGIEKRAPFLEVTEEDYRAVLEVNLTAPFFLSQAFARHLKESGRPGSIVNISSVHEDLPFPNFAPYCVSKGGLRMMMRDLAIELASYGITVNNIAPGAIETPINRHLLGDPKLLNPLLANIPLRRMGKPADVAHIAAFLASSEAAYITGATIVVDGGLLWNYTEQ